MMSDRTSDPLFSKKQEIFNAIGHVFRYFQQIEPKSPSKLTITERMSDKSSKQQNYHN